MTTRDVVTRCVAWALVVGCLVTIAAMFVAGARVTSYDNLREAVEAGDVDEIQVSGGLDVVQGRGSAPAEIYWRDRIVPRVTEVQETTAKQRDGWSSHSSSDPPTVHGRVDEELLALDPELRIVRPADDRALGQPGIRITFGTPQVRGWLLPGWTLLLGLVMIVGTLGLLIAGPEPRRATRWAWFWLLGLAAPLGTLAFLFLSGATSFRPTPARKEGRLTGGWAFLLSFLIGSALGTFGAVVL